MQTLESVCAQRAVTLALITAQRESTLAKKSDPYLPTSFLLKWAWNSGERWGQAASLIFSFSNPGCSVFFLTGARWLHRWRRLLSRFIFFILVSLFLSPCLEQLKHDQTFKRRRWSDGAEQFDEVKHPGRFLDILHLKQPLQKKKFASCEYTRGQPPLPPANNTDKMLLLLSGTNKDYSRSAAL